MNDWDILNRKLNAQRQQQAAAEQLRIKQEQANAIKNQPTGLAAVLNGIGQSIGNVGESIYNMFGTGAASVRDLFTGNAGTGKYTKEWQQYRKEQMGDKDMSDKDYYLKTGGKALDAAATVSDLIPGLGTGARVALNVGQGVASGVGQQFADNGSNVTSDDLIKAGLIGGASAGAGQLAGLKLGQKALKNPATSKIGKALQSNVGRAALTGAASGATGGGLASALNGGSFIGGALEGAKTGALGGATIAGTMGLIGSGLNKVNKKITTPTAQTVAETPEAIITKAAAQDIAETPAAATRRSIPVTDYDAGEQTVKVKRANAPTGEYSLGKNAGSTLDGILGPNNPRKLPNAVAPTNDALIQKATGDADVYDFIKNFADEGKDTLAVLKEVLSPEDYDAVVRNTREYAGIQADAFGGATNANSKSQLPQLNRQQYYEDTIGKLVSQGGDMRAADVPDYMESHLSNPKDMKERYVRGGNDEILRELFNDDESSISDLYQRYEELAQAANQNEIFTPENISKGLNLDSELAGRVGDAVLREYGLKQNVDVNAYPSLRKPIDVGFEGAPSGETVYTKRILPGKTEQNLPAPATPAQLAPIEDTPLIEKGSPEYNQIMRQREIANRQRQYRDTVVGGVLDQYGTTRISDRVNGINDAIMEVADLGLTRRADIDGFANAVTGRDGEVSKLIRKSLNSAGKTNGRIDVSMEDVFNAVGASEGAQKQIKSFFNDKGKKYAVDQNGNMARSDMYDFGKELEKEAYRMIDRGERLQNDQTLRYGQGLRILGEEYISKATDGVDIKANINVNKLKNILPGNEKWAAKVDDFANNARTIQDARSFIAAPTKMALLGQAAEFNQNTFGANMGNMGRDAGRAIRAGTSRNPIIAVGQIAAEKALTSDAAKQKAIRNAVKGYQNIEAGGTGKTGVKGAVKNIAAKVGDKIDNFGNKINDDTFSNLRLRADNDNYLRTPGEIATDQVIRQAGLGAANSENTKALRQAIAGELMDAQTQYENAKNIIDSLPTSNTTANKGVQQLQTISNAMEAALAAGDITAYGQLANLYKKAYAVYGQDTTTTAKALSATQSKALTAAQQLDQLAQMTPDAGTALASSPLGFLVDLGGGNQYANQAKALATTLGYLLSGANIRETEAERIGQAYVPSAFDSEPVRQQKLERARQLIQSYMGSTDDLTQA